MKRYVARFTLITLIGVSLIFAAWLASSSAGSQQQARLVVPKPWPVEPVKVVAVKTKNKENIEIGKPFDEDDDWLDGFTVTVANHYDKAVTAVTLNGVPKRARRHQAAVCHGPAFWPKPMGPRIHSPGSK